MRLTLKIVGGFTGPAAPETCSLDLESSSRGVATTLQGLVGASGFFDLPGRLLSERPAPWDFLHELTVEDGARRHTVVYHLGAAPEALQRLTHALTDAHDRGEA